jgi:hypothetical protein
MSSSSAGNVQAVDRNRIVPSVLAVSPPTGVPGAHSLALATLVSWLITEAFGAYMLSAWIASGGIRRREADEVPRSVIFGHAGLAFTGFVLWIAYVAAGSVALAWASICFLAPAIGLGISTVTIWTPYPARERSEEPKPQGSGALGITTNERLAAALDDEELATALVDDLVTSMLDQADPQPRRMSWRIAPIVPATHGLLAIATILLAMLAAVSAS